MSERRSVLTAALAVALLAASATAVADEGGAVRAVLELGRNFYYTGEPLRVRVSIGNEGDTTVANPVESPILRGFRVVDENGDPVEATGKPTAEEPARPEKLAPLAFYGSIVDLAEIFPAIREGGKFRIEWAADGLASQTVEVQVIPRYDPTRDYRAILGTDEGDIVIEFFRDESPVAVKAFIDMANTGVYDGLLFHEVHTDDYVVAGSPVASGSERRVISYPAEQSSLPVVAGTVLMRPVSAAPPANSSPFMIVLRPHPEWTGQATVLGQVVSGLEAVRKISRRPSTQETSRPFYRPLSDVRIRSIRVEEKTAAPETDGAPASGS